MGFRILVIKLAAIGDVLRTTPILVPLRTLHDPCHVTWITDPGAVELLRTVPEIDRPLAYSPETVLHLGQERFDLLICLDKEPRATALATLVAAAEKKGFGMTPQGTLTLWNPEAEYAYRLGLSDKLKFVENRKSYQEIVFEALGLPLGDLPRYLFSPTSDERDRALGRLRELGASQGTRLVGLNTGCGPVFATKKWTEDGFVTLAGTLASQQCDDEHGRVACVLLGGPEERERNARIRTRATEMGARCLDTGCDNSLREFAALVSCLDLLVTGDTLALHLGIAASVPVLLIMGSTSAAEIEIYGRGSMLVSDFPCAPCYLRVCPLPLTCMEAMPVETVVREARKLLATHHATEER